MKTITHDELTQKMLNGEEFVLVNVLPADYFDQAHIPGSASAPFDSNEFIASVEEIAGSKDTQVVVYCANHSCSASSDAAKALADGGFSDVIDFAGGTQEWMEAGKPLQSRMAGGCGSGSCGCAA